MNIMREREREEGEKERERESEGREREEGVEGGVRERDSHQCSKSIELC